jgi:pyruvate/2-oxoglutarate dehydrogenase complex dihydrolipoamide dehydrogenase (E3) component
VTGGGAAHPHMPDRYDLIVIGAGSGGLTAAAGAARLKARVALIERSGRLGGDCLWTGCVPSKSLLHAARVAHLARNAGRFGVRAGPVQVDFPAVMRRLREVQHHIEAESDNAERFGRLGAEVIFGAAELVARDEVAVGGRRLRAGAVLIATGSRPVIPDIAGVAEGDLLTSDTLFSLERLPATLVIVGGGPVGVEMSQAFARLGSRVVLVHRGPRLLPREDAEIAEALTAVLTGEGVDVRPATQVTHIEVHGDRRTVFLRSAADADRVEADAVLSAAGRRPNVEGLGLDRVGVACSPRGITVDASMRTTAAGVFAVGDVVDGPRFTHIASAQAKAALSAAVLRIPRSFDPAGVPWAIFTEPEVGHFGPTEAELVGRGVEHVVARSPFSANDRALCEGETVGLVKLLLSPVQGRILGAHILGPRAGELVHEFSIAAAAGMSAPALAATVHAYPTYAGAGARAIDAFVAGKIFDGPIAGVLEQVITMFR